MANQQIHEYTTTATSIGADDYFDMDQFDGVNYVSAKISGADLLLANKAGMYSQTAASSDITGTTPLSILSGVGQGTLSVPGDTFKIGDTFTAEIGGIMSSASNQTIEIAINGGMTSNIELLNTGAISITTATNKVFSFKATFVVRSIGIAGIAEIAVHSRFTTNNNSSNKDEVFSFFSTNNTTFYTTNLNKLDITAHFGGSSASNKIRSEIFSLVKVY